MVKQLDSLESQTRCNYSITEIAKMKRIEGNMLKKIIGMAKTCVSEPLYGALNLETVEESILKQ